jgi:L-ascorbate metabolism protein UlaG (beta-lactamase superfamily)
MNYSLKGTHITWLGHATVLVQTAKGTNLLIDPFILYPAVSRAKSLER